MITETSLCNESTLYKVFDCIEQSRKLGYNVYLTNRNGRNIIQCKWNAEKRSSEWYIGNKNVTKVVQGAFRRYLKADRSI